MSMSGATSPHEVRLHEALARSVRDSLEPTALVLALLHAVLAPSHLLFVAHPARIPLVFGSVAACGVYLWLWRRWRRQPPALSRAHACAGLLAALVLLGVVFHMSLVPEPQQTTNLALFVLGVGFLVLARSWFTVFIVAALASWAGLAAAAPPSPAWIHFGFLLLMATALSVATHVVRVRTLRRIEGSRLASERERLRVERESLETLRESEERSRVLLSAIPDLIFRMRRDGTYLDFVEPSPGATYIPPDEFLGRKLEDVLPPEVSVPGREALDKAMASGEIVEFEYRLTIDGQERSFEARIVPYAKDDAVAIVRDVTEPRRAEAERRRIQEQVSRAQKLESLGLLAGGIAHDFNNLLTGILGNAALAVQQMPTDGEERELILQVVQAAERAGALTRQLLAYAGRGGFEIESLDLSEQVREIMPLISRSIPKTVELRLDLAPDLPRVEADPGQAQQVVMNLVINGAEACGDEPGTVTVTTRAIEAGGTPGAAAELDSGVPPGSYVSLEVRDSGRGIDPEDRARIFDPFFTTKLPGRGLGLAAVSGIVRGHGGHVSVQSLPEENTTFRVLLPAASRTVPISAPHGARDLSGRGLILVVDDEPAVRNFVRRALSAYGYQVLTAEGGRSGLEILRERTSEIDLLLIDVNMPEMGGPETLRAMRTIRPDASAILISGYDEAEATRRLADQPRIRFLPKPFSPQALAAIVKEVLEARGKP